MIEASFRTTMVPVDQLRNPGAELDCGTYGLGGKAVEQQAGVILKPFANAVLKKAVGMFHTVNSDL
jgi:hypothetical protein